MLRRLNDNQRRTLAHWVMEFVVVVFGVLIALWLQERVSKSNDEERMRAAEAAIHSELDDNLMILIAHTAVDQCLADRIHEIEGQIRQQARTRPIVGHALTERRTLKKPGSADIMYTFFDLRVQDSAWTSAQASGTLAQMDRKKFNKLAEIYGEYRMVDDALTKDIESGNALQVLGYGTDLTPDLRARLVGAMTQASHDRQFLTNSVSPAYVASQMRELGWDDKAAIDSRIADFTKTMHGFGVYLRPCAKPFTNPFTRN
jgi:hypothetical protein